MGGVAVIGDPVLVRGWELAGVRVFGAVDAASAREAWRDLDADVDVVLLTEDAAGQLAAELAGLTWPLVVVIPP
jgi:vacuolar-type H+-ATPase subunit F/Vma7